MLRYIADPANAVTTGGLLFSALGLHLALAGRPELAVAAVLWAVLADHLDGVIAARAKHRSPETARIGKSLDGFADLVYGAVFPVVVVIQVSEASFLSLVIGTALLLAGAIRLSYFSSFGLSSTGCFKGVPLSYDVPLLALGFLVRPWLPESGFDVALNLLLLSLAVLHVAPVSVPAPGRAAYAVIAVYSLAASSALLTQAYGSLPG